MSESIASGRRITAYALLPEAPRPRNETPIPGHLCEVCLDALAVHLQTAPWGGDGRVRDLPGAVCLTRNAETMSTSPSSSY